jgi:hypothetical protein
MLPENAPHRIPTAFRTAPRNSEKLNQLIASTRAYIETLERDRAFVAVAVPGLHLEEGEFAVRHDRAKLEEFHRVRVGGGLGTRVRIGKIPIYLGGWKSVPKDELQEVGAGYLVLTNHRLLFLGARTLTIPFDHLLTCEQQNTGLVVSESRSKSPHVFFLENPGLWCFSVNYLANTRLEDPKLPDDEHFKVVGEAPKLRVEVNRAPLLPRAENSTA